MQLSNRVNDAAVRSLEGLTTLPLTCVTYACQCHQGASIFHLGISLPMALHCTSLASTPPLLPIPSTARSSRHLSLTCHFFHQLVASSNLLALGLGEGGNGNHQSENGDHFVPVPGLAAATDDTSVRC